MRPVPPPRLYVIVATKAPVALVFRRGPSDWWHLLKWNLDDGSLGPGVWVKKKLFPRRCDLSPDGALMCFCLAGGFPPRASPTIVDEYYPSGATGAHRVFGGISRVPWLHPLKQWEESGTWGRGWSFADNPEVESCGSPSWLTINGKETFIRQNEIISFLNERRRGWIEAEDCPTRDADDMWDEKRSVVLQKVRPGGTEVLRLNGGLYTTAGGVDGKNPRFELQDSTGVTSAIGDATWADWDHTGRLLVATHAGHLRVDSLDASGVSPFVNHDLCGLVPDPQPAPEWARVGA